jgi:hypothetical protein
LSRFEIENPQDDQMRFDTRRMTGRVAVSLAVAIFAYLGLLFGGNLVLGPTRGPNNAFSSSSKDSQPLQVSARDVVRGVLAADRKVAQKYATYASGDAAQADQPVFQRSSLGLLRLSQSTSPTFYAADAKPYDSHGPPAFAA